MTKREKSNKGWILGTVLGAVGGAAYALWKTPMSGQEIRGKLTPGGNTSAGQSETVTTGGSVSNKFMHLVEHKLAPLVGVQLGKTANTRTGDAESVSVNKTVYTATPKTEQTADITEPESINAKRWAWGSPAPEVNVVEDPKFQAAETAQVEANLPESAPDQDDDSGVASSSDGNSSFGDGPIRNQRFGWGDPAPETTTAPAATEFNAVPSAAGVMPEQTPRGASLIAPVGGDDNVGTTTSTADINPERTESGSSLTTPSPQQRVVPTSATDAVASAGTVSGADSTNVDDAILVSAAGQSTGKMNQFPKLGGLED